jgi:hypothetical protein
MHVIIGSKTGDAWHYDSAAQPSAKIRSPRLLGHDFGAPLGSTLNVGFPNRPVSASVANQK